MEPGGVVSDVGGGEQATAWDGFTDAADDDAVHDDFSAGLKVVDGEFLLSGNGCADGVFLAGDGNGGACGQIGKCDEDVIPRIELDGFGRCHWGNHMLRKLFQLLKRQLRR